MTKKTIDIFRVIRWSIIDMGVAIVSGCGFRVKWTSPIDLLGQKTLGSIPYLLLLCDYEFIHVKFEIFPRSSKGRGHRLRWHIIFFPPKFFLIYRPYSSQITSQTFYTQMIVRIFGQILDYNNPFVSDWRYACTRMTFSKLVPWTSRDVAGHQY